jgi:hypothetical protein
VRLALTTRSSAPSCAFQRAGCVEKRLADGETLTITETLALSTTGLSTGATGVDTMSAICVMPGQAGEPMPKSVLADYVDCLLDGSAPDCNDKLWAYYDVTGCGIGSLCAAACFTAQAAWRRAWGCKLDRRCPATCPAPACNHAERDLSSGQQSALDARQYV